MFINCFTLQHVFNIFPRQIKPKQTHITDVLNLMLLSYNVITYIILPWLGRFVRIKVMLTQTRKYE